MLKGVILTISVLFVYHLIGQVSDYNNFKNYLKCEKEYNSKTHIEFEFDCYEKKHNSAVYNFLLKIEIPRATECLYNKEQARFPCKLLNLP